MGDKKFTAMLQLANNTGVLMSCSINALEVCVWNYRNGNIKPNMFKRNKEIVLIKLHNPWGEIEWNIDGLLRTTAGGCINNANTFYENPQYSILVHKPTTLVVTLIQRYNDNNFKTELKRLQ
nr:11563_t:CDS:2 [Entrophospora candida]CAG8647080.1 10859_t:CDS:2 [Entrophospora candida]